MHDGRIPTLDAVLAHYNARGRTIRSDPHQGVGADNPFKSEFMKRMELTPTELRDITAFLRSLTDSAFLTDTRFSNPWISR